MYIRNDNRTLRHFGVTNLCLTVIKQKLYISGGCNRWEQSQVYTDWQIVLIRCGNRAHDIMTRIQTPGPRDLGSISSKEARNFLFSKLSKNFMGPIQNSVQWCMANYFRRRKLSVCEAEHWLRFSAEIRNEWSYVSIPPHGFVSRTYTTFTFIIWAHGGVVVKELRYKLAGRGFDSRWCHRNFSVTYSFRSHYGPGVDSTSNRNEYQVISWG